VSEGSIFLGGRALGSSTMCYSRTGGVVAGIDTGETGGGLVRGGNTSRGAVAGIGERGVFRMASRRMASPSANIITYRLVLNLSRGAELDKRGTVL
jgi:hypothetical protein